MILPHLNVVRKTTMFLIVLTFAAVLPAVAATLGDYHKRLDAARVGLGRLEDGSNAKREKLEEIRSSIPLSERLEWEGGSVETDNQWLHDALSAYFDERDAKKRKTALLGIEERLAAIGEKIDELEKATAAEQTKDEDKQKLAEILRREEYQKPEVKDESLFQRWWREFWEWLAKFFPRPALSPESTPGYGSLKFALQILIFAVVIGLVGFLLYRFLPFLTGRFGSGTKKKRGDRVILGERIGEDESADDLFGEAERLAHDGHLREAIRKGYIAVLCELSDRKIIGLARYKTNRDYLRDVRKRQGLFENMSGLTGSYERNWYGLRPSEQNDWEEFRAKYKQTVMSANS